MMAALTVALIADTHGVLDPRIAALVAGCDLCVHAGDIGGAAVLDRLRPRQALYAVAGNNDTARHWGADRSRLEELPPELTVVLPGGVLAVIHGDRIVPAKERHRRLRRRYPEARGVVYGHSHRQVIDRETVPWVLNPGAAGRSRTFGGPACLVLHAAADRWRVQARRFAPA